MALVVAGETSFGRRLMLDNIQSGSYTLYFPSLSVENRTFFGGVSVVQVNTPYSGILREEDWIPLYTYSTRLLPPSNLSGRAWYLWVDVSGLQWELHR